MANNSLQTASTIKPGTTSEVHTYKFKPWLILYQLFSLSMIGCLLAVPLALIIPVFVPPTSAVANDGTFPTILLIVFAPLALVFLLIFVKMVIDLISSINFYIRITPDGIENRIWPYRHIRSRWSDLDQLGTYLFYDVVYLKSYEVIGASLSFAWPMKYLNLFPTSIFVSQYQGWPDSELADDLRHYAPHLFENQGPVGQPRASAQDTNGSGISQEQRLLAALSHASVLFTGIGIFVPLLVYTTQRKKSDYLAFQSLQAFLYQLSGYLFNFFLSLCMVATVLMPIWSAPLLGDKNSFEKFFSSFLVVLVVAVTLVTFGSFAYSIYGLIGAIRTYQGKTFRYLIIGKQVEKIGS